MKVVNQKGKNSLDELHKLINGAVQQYESAEYTEDDLIEFLLSLLYLAYKRGTENTEDVLDYLIDTDSLEYAQKVDRAVEKEIAGETTNERLEAYIKANDIPSLVKVATTETHRVYNQAVQETAEQVQDETGLILYKRWVTMEDDRVRDTHSYLNNERVPLNDRFYTYDNDSALYPSGFDKAENNINCRCYLEIEE